MKKNLLTIAVWIAAGPDAAAKTHKIAHQIDKSWKRRKAAKSSTIDWKNYRHDVVVIVN